MVKYKVRISIDGENFFYVIIENGKVINRNAIREDLVKIMTKELYYNETNICPICREEKERYGIELSDRSILFPKNSRHKKNECGEICDIYVCNRHSHSIIGNRDPNSSNAKGNKGEELLCKLKGYTNLNRKYGKYPIDCIDEITGDYYQVKIANYNSIEGCWSQIFKNEYRSIRQGFRFRNLHLFCIHEDKQTIERYYEIPEKELKQSISIRKNPSKGFQWYEKYRIYDHMVLERINDIWKRMLERQNAI